MAAIKSTFEPVILTHLYPQSRVDIFVQVQQDGGLLSASISTITLEHITTDIALFDSAPTVSSGVHFTLPLLGLTTLEENNVLHLTVAVVPRTGKVTLVTLKMFLHESEEDNESDSDNILPKMNSHFTSPSFPLVHGSDISFSRSTLVAQNGDEDPKSGAALVRKVQTAR